MSNLKPESFAATPIYAIDRIRLSAALLLPVGIEGLEDLQRDLAAGLERAARTLDAVPKAANG